MPAGATYEPIATTTLGSSASSVTFSSISGAYTDLILVITAKSTIGNTDNYIRFNGDTANNYSTTWLTGNGSAATSGRESNQAGILLDYGAYLKTTGFTLCIVQIMNYSNSTTYKTVLTRSNDANTGVDALVGLWRKTPEAITSLTLDPVGTQGLEAGSTFTLYGIAAA